MSSADLNSQRKILVVEDEKPLSHALDVQLTKEGFSVSVAEDGEEAMDLLKKQDFDLILLDIIMPKMNGFLFLEELQKLHAPSVVILSNLGQREDIEKGKSLGVKEYLIKASSPMALVIEKVKEVLRQCE